jgi:hypothetical protein
MSAVRVWPGPSPHCGFAFCMAPSQPLKSSNDGASSTIRLTSSGFSCASKAARYPPHDEPTTFQRPPMAVSRDVSSASARVVVVSA